MSSPRPLRPSSLCVMLPGLALGLAACSFSFKAGSGSTEAGKPAQSDPATPTGTTTKPIAKTDPGTASDPGASDPVTEPGVEPGAEPATEPATEPSGPTRVPPSNETPPPAGAPGLTAVCRVEEPALADLCHTALDPIAADDFGAWQVHFGPAVTLIRPSHRAGMQRIQGAADIRELAGRAGGLRALLHLDPADRVVGTLHNDCRRCRRSFVAFGANSRSGTIVVTLEMSKPPRISLVEVASAVSRRPLGKVRRPSKGPKGPTKTIDPAGPVTPEPEPEPEAPPSGPALKAR